MAHKRIDRSDRQWLHDMYREMEQEPTKPDPSEMRNMCKCGHSISKHYQLTTAMPCGKCRCDWCTAPAAEGVRQKRKRMGAPEITPMSRVFRGGK
jgi:hypothetical protein